MRWALLLLAGCGRVGFSVAGDATTDASIDARPDAPDASPLAPCDGQNLQFVDGFASPAVDPMWQPYGGALTTQQVGGALRLDFRMPIAANQFAGYIGQTVFTASNFCVTAEVSSTPAGPAYIYLAYGDADGKVEVDLDQDTLAGFYQNGADAHGIGAVPWVSQLRAVRMWGTPATVHWEYSLDDVTWTEWAQSDAATFDRSSVTLRLGGGTNGAVTDSGLGEWGSISLLGE